MTDKIVDLGMDFYQDPESTYRRLRPLGPIHRVRTPEGLVGWLVIDYAVARRLLAHSGVKKDGGRIAEIVETSQSGYSAAATAVAVSKHMLNMDPPDHRRLRDLVAKAFTAASVNALQPRIVEIADDLIDAMHAQSGPVDLLSTFATQLPMAVICELLGIPNDDRVRFQGWYDAILSVATPESVRSAATDTGAYLAGLVAQCRLEPAPGILSALVQARDSSDALTDDEVVSMSFLLMIGGHETTANLIATTMRTLLIDRHRFDLLRANPGLIPAAIEEHLRFEGPVHLATLRFADAPITVHEQQINKGDLLFISLSAANLDPARFSSPNLADYDRDTSGHLAFGHGLHYCLGAALARMEATTAISRLIDAFPEMVIASTEPPRWRPSGRIRALTSLQVRLH